MEPIEEPPEIDSGGDLLGDDAESITRWLAWLDSLQPLTFTPEQEAALQEARRQRRAWEKSRFDERAEQFRELFE